MTTTDDIAALRAALDAGDDGVLPVLADALEEAGDARAAGLRRIGDRRPLDTWDPMDTWARRHGWLLENCPGVCFGKHTAPAQLPAKVFRRMLRRTAKIVSPRVDYYYPTRSAAYLALATALTTE